MRIKDLCGHIDFDTFWVLGIFKAKNKPSAILLAPKNSRKDKFFNLQLGEKSLWYNSLENMLAVSSELGYTNTLQNVLMKHKYNRLIKKH